MDERCENWRSYANDWCGEHQPKVTDTAERPDR